jgi:hypothetical protein
MKPSVTLFVSGPAPCANAPAGSDARAAPINAAVAVAPLRTPRRPNLMFFIVALLN